MKKIIRWYNWEIYVQLIRLIKKREVLVARKKFLLKHGSEYMTKASFYKWLLVSIAWLELKADIRKLFIITMKNDGTKGIEKDSDPLENNG